VYPPPEGGVDVSGCIRRRRRRGFISVDPQPVAAIMYQVASAAGGGVDVSGCIRRRKAALMYQVVSAAGGGVDVL